MKTIRLGVVWNICIVIAFFLVIGACTDSSSSKSTYSITVTNLTNNQPLSPQGFVLHRAGYQAWQTGEQASDSIAC